MFAFAKFFVKNCQHSAITKTQNDELNKLEEFSGEREREAQQQKNLIHAFIISRQSQILQMDLKLHWPSSICNYWCMSQDIKVSNIQLRYYQPDILTAIKSMRHLFAVR